MALLMKPQPVTSLNHALYINASNWWSP